MGTFNAKENELIKKIRQYLKAASEPATVRVSGGGEGRRWPTKKERYLCYFVGEIPLSEHIFAAEVGRGRFKYFAPLPRWQNKTATSDIKRYVPVCWHTKG